MRLFFSIFLSAFVGLAAGPVLAQEREWKIGGQSDNRWSDWSHLNVLADVASVPGALQPLELRPDVNITPTIYDAHTWELWQNPPNPLWVQGIPRFWRGFGNYGPKTPGPTTSTMIDGDPTTFWSQTNFGPGGCKMTQEFHTLSFGGPLPLEQFILRLPPPEMTDLFGEPWQNYVPRNGELSAAWHGAEGKSADEQQRDAVNSRDLVYTPFESVLGSVKNNIKAPIEFEWPLEYFSHVRWRSFADKDWRPGCKIVEKLGYADLELYGRGFAGKSRYDSKPVKLSQPAILGEVSIEISKWRRQDGHWEENVDSQGRTQRIWIEGELVPAPDADAEIQIRFKTGTTDDPRKYHTYTDFGELAEIERSAWDNLEDSAQISCHGKCSGPIIVKSPGWRGPVTQDRENWTPWSGPLSSSGTRLGLAKGQYFQFSVNMISRNPTDVARLESLHLEVLPLLAPTLVGEIAIAAGDTDPAATLARAPVGEPIELTYAIRAAFEGKRRQGFNAIRIATPSKPEFMHLFMGTPLEEIELGADEIYIDESGLTLFLPQSVDQDSELRVGLRTTLYTVSEKLLGEVFNREDEALRQIIEEGNASDQIGTDQLQLVAESDLPATIANLQIEPRIVTPNGDGTNDLVQVTYSLFGVIDTEVEVNFYTIAGKPVRRILATQQTAGANPPVQWNGRDESDQLLPPGLYLCQVVTTTSHGRFANTTPISIVY